MKLILLIVCYLSLIHASPQPLLLNNIHSVGNYYSLSKNVITGITDNVRDFLSTPKELLEAGKNLIAGYPYEVVYSTINSFCSAAVSTDKIVSKIKPDINQMHFQLRSPCKNYSFPLLNAKDLWKHSVFDGTKKTVVLVTGWTTNINKTNTISKMAQAYHCRGGYNFIAFDAAAFIDSLYTWSALNTETIGEDIGRGLVELAEITPLENIHVIGHSLGAHIVGAAGRTFNNLTGKLLPRITGLDPAKPCFNEGESLSGLLRGDAEFIDVIHTNPGVMAKRDPLGDVDFYPGGVDPLPPGCISVGCAHARAMLFYIESVFPGNEENFLGVRCTSLRKLKNNECRGLSFPMGYATPQNLKGIYFLDVKSKSPFGMNGNKGRDEQNKKCGLCEVPVPYAEEIVNN